MDVYEGVWYIGIYISYFVKYSNNVYTVKESNLRVYSRIISASVLEPQDLIHPLSSYTHHNGKSIVTVKWSEK